MNKEELKLEIDRLNDEANKIWRKAELLSAELEALKNKDLEPLWKECKFILEPNSFKVIVPPEKVMLILNRDSGFNHFEFPISKNIEVRCDDGVIKLQFTFKNETNDPEIYKGEWGTRVLLEYLYSVGVTKANIAGYQADRMIQSYRKNFEHCEQEKARLSEAVNKIFGE